MNALDEARALDDADVLKAFRDEFVFPKSASGDDVVYLTGNSLGLMPKKTRETVNAELEAWGRLGVEGHFAAEGAAFSSPKQKGSAHHPEAVGPAEPWFSYHELVRDRAAALVGALPSEVVAMGSLTANLHLMMVSFYRPTATRYKIVIEAGAFPSDQFLVQSQARFHGHDVADAVIEVAPRAGETLLRTEDIEAALEKDKDSIALVLLSGINYYTGQLFEMKRITAFAKARNMMVGWDLAHAAGNVPLNLHDDGADFAAWCTYKYLNSGPGAVAMCFIHERHHQSFELPRFCGWWSNKPETRFAHKGLDLSAGADGWQISNAPILSLAALHASLDVFTRAGRDRLHAKSQALTGFLERLLVEVAGAAEEDLTPRFARPSPQAERVNPDAASAAGAASPITILTPRDPAHRGAQLSLRAAGVHGEKLQALLHERGVCVDFRRPDVIRAAPAPLYCRYVDVVRFVDILKECL